MTKEENVFRKTITGGESLFYCLKLQFTDVYISAEDKCMSCHTLYNVVKWEY